VYGAPKKKPAIVKEIVRKNTLLPHELSYIGDALSDCTAAQSNGVPFIARIHRDKNIF